MCGRAQGKIPSPGAPRNFQLCVPTSFRSSTSFYVDCSSKAEAVKRWQERAAGKKSEQRTSSERPESSGPWAGNRCPQQLEKDFWVLPCQVSPRGSHLSSCWSPGNSDPASVGARSECVKSPGRLEAICTPDLTWSFGFSSYEEKHDIVILEIPPWGL